MKFRVNEIFSSIQGEGALMGKPCTFIRLAGCNKTCRFCDTDHEDFADMTLPEIKQQCFNLENGYIVITGGEPLLSEGIAQLVDALKLGGFQVGLETNGSIPLPCSFDYVTVSPKGSGDVMVTHANEVRVMSPLCLEHFERSISADNYFVSVKEVDGRFLIDEALELLKGSKGWRLSFQAHKLLGLK